MADAENTNETAIDADEVEFDDHADDEVYDLSDVEIVEEEEGLADDE